MPLAQAQVVFESKQSFDEKSDEAFLHQHP